MRRLLATVLGALIFGSTRPAHANDAAYIGELAGFGVLIIADVVVGVGAVVAGIGSSVQTTRQPPTRGWAIASLVVGSLIGVLGAITGGVMLGSELDLRGWPVGWSIVGVSLVSSAVNITLGGINLSRIPAPSPLIDEAPDDLAESSRGTNPSIRLSFTW